MSILHAPSHDNLKESKDSIRVTAPINAFIYFGLGWIGYNQIYRFRTKWKEIKHNKKEWDEAT